MMAIQENWITEFKKALFSDNDENTAFQIRDRNIPVSVFKYRSLKCENHLNAVFNGRVFLSKIQDFNDPYEFHFQLDYERIATALAKARGWPDDFLQTGLRLMRQNTIGAEFNSLEFVEKFRQDVRVCAFASDPLSILMWGHYAENHTGFCVEYQTSIEYFSRNLFPVIYSDELFDATNEVVCGINGDPIIQHALWEAALTKYQDWSYEREWRFIASAEDGELCTHNNSKYFEVGMPKAIYLGSESCRAENRSILIDYCIDNKISVFEMKKDLRTYGIAPIPLHL